MEASLCAASTPYPRLLEALSKGVAARCLACFARPV